jgi:hypothetical protein
MLTDGKAIPEVSSTSRRYPSDTVETDPAAVRREGPNRLTRPPCPGTRLR